MAEVALPAVAVMLNAISFLKSFLNEHRNLTDCSVETLKSNISKAWEVIQILGESQLQGNEISMLQDNAVKTLTRWCYDAEDLVEERKLKHQGISIIKDIWKKLTKPDEILKVCEDITAMLTVLNDGSHQSSTNLNLLNGTDDGSGLDTLIGRETEFHHIIKVLVSCQERGSNGISIVGMCGIGKTLLARTIIKHPNIVSQFPYISLVEAKGGKFVWDDMEKEINKHQVRTSSQKKKFLVLIENLQDMEHLEWHKFLIFRKKQSIDVTIMVTTRNPTISESTGTSLYSLGILSDDCCIEVIKENARHQHREGLASHHLQEEEKLKSVAKKCEGLPFAAKMFGMMIANFKNDNDWDNILRVRRLSQVPPFKKEILSALVSSSYKNLKTELWRCVAYLSLFPVGHQFDLEDLVHLWVGECFVPFEDESSLKDIKNKYIDDLKKRSIILQSSEISYKLHSLGEDIALSASSETCLRIRQDDDEGLLSHALHRNPRHLSLFFNSTILAELEKLKNLRTFLSLHDDINSGQIKGIHDKLYRAISSVRVLSLKGTNITKLPSFIGKLKYLRYLDISFTLVQKLPDDVGHLHALQFLKLKGTPISCLPKNFHKLTNLVYVDWDKSYLRALQGLRKIGSLSRLENLPLFKVGDQNGYMVSELKDMNKLQGSLHIQNLEMVMGTEMAKEAMLHKKSELTTIVLEWSSNSSGSADAENVLRGLKPYAYVKQLKLIKYGGEQFPADWISGDSSLKSLQKIHLCECKSCSFFPVLGKLQHLKTLVLEDMHSITEVSCRSLDDANSSKDDNLFPKLESLKLCNMTRFQRMMGLRTSDMTRLLELKVDECNEIELFFSSNNINELSEKLKTIFDGKVWDHTLKIVVNGVELEAERVPENENGESEVEEQNDVKHDEKDILSKLKNLINKFLTK